MRKRRPTIRLKTGGIFYFCFLFMVLPATGLAGQIPEIVINEIAWMGTETSANDEWLELYNNSEREIDLGGWKLKSKDGSPDINLAGEIKPFGFFILERSDDKTLPAIKADLIYTGSLKNTGETLFLLDSQNNIIDEVGCQGGWFAGDNKSKQTMARISSFLSGNNEENWQSSENPGGTPGARNTFLLPAPATKTEEESRKTKPAPAEAVLLIVYPRKILINEILPSPEGADAENEFIELFNDNDFEADLSGWIIRDTVGKTKAFTMPSQTKIGAKGFLLLKRSQTKITLNNDGDGLKLLNPAGEVVSEIDYPKAIKAKSFSRFGEEWLWSALVTPGEANARPEPEKTSSPEENAGDLQEQKPWPATLAFAALPGISFPAAFFIAFLVSVIFTLAIIRNKNKLRPHGP